MKFMTIKEASEKWNISERRIRQLIQDGRILGAEKIGTAWYIPNDVGKPVDKRVKDEIEFKIVGKANVNEWCGNVTPQIMIEDYEVKDITFDF